MSVPYPTRLTVTPLGSTTESPYKFSLSVKNATSSAVILERLKVDIGQASAGTVGGTRIDYDIMGLNDVAVAAGATVSYEWYRAIPRDGSYSATVSVMKSGSWQGDAQLGTERQKTFTVAYSPKGDINADKDSDISMAFDSSALAKELRFYSAKADTTNGKFVVEASNIFTGAVEGRDHYAEGKFVRGNFTHDGKTDICALYDDGDGTCTIKVYASDGDAYVDKGAWFTTGGWRFGASIPLAADVNGDGDDDLVILYNTSSGGTNKVEARVFASDGGAFGYAGTYLALSSTTVDLFNDAQFSAGDLYSRGGDAIFDGGDGVDDLLVLASAGSTASKLEVHGMSSAGGAKRFEQVVPFAADKIKLLCGDLNEDSYDDAVLVYRGRVSGDTNGISFVVSKSTGTAFGAPVFWLDASGASHWDRGKFVCGDFTADGKADIGVLYDDMDGTATFRMYPSTGSAIGAGKWDFATSGWMWNRTRLLERGVSATPPQTRRIGGADRYSTSVEISKAGWPGGASTVVVCTGKNFPDALAAAPLAYAYGGPLLLTDPKALNTSIRDEIARLKATKVFLIGGVNVVSPEVEAAVRSLGINDVTRIQGVDRYETAARVARALKDKSGVPYRPVICTGENYPDALAAAPVAARMGWPILLVRRDTIPEPTKAFLTEIAAQRTLVAGGESAVSKAVEAQLPAPVRKGGADRYATSDLISSYGTTYGSSFGMVGLACGTNFPDALSGAVLTARRGGVMELTPSTSVSAVLTSRCAHAWTDIDMIYAYGSASAVSDAVVTSVQRSAR